MVADDSMAAAKTQVFGMREAVQTRALTGVG